MPGPAVELFWLRPAAPLARGPQARSEAASRRGRRATPRPDACTAGICQFQNAEYIWWPSSRPSRDQNAVIA